MKRITPLISASVILALFVFFSLVQAGSIGGKATELYDNNDKLEILTNSTFGDAVYNKSNVWVVEFYNSWCGFCQRFAPTWKEFAKSVYGMYMPSVIKRW
jgi:thiol-disulfide isomerase/thioredoxin